MMYTFNPIAPVPAVSISIVILASSANEESEITGAVTAVLEVNSVASIVIFVEIILVPPSLISMVGVPLLEAVDKLALTAVTVKA